MALGLNRVFSRKLPSCSTQFRSREQTSFACRIKIHQAIFFFFFFSQALSKKIDTRTLGKSTLIPRAFLAASWRFIGVLAKSQLLLKLIKRPLFAPLSAAKSWRKKLRSSHPDMVYWRMHLHLHTSYFFGVPTLEKFFCREIFEVLRDWNL